MPDAALLIVENDAEAAKHVILVRIEDVNGHHAERVETLHGQGSNGMTRVARCQTKKMFDESRYVRLHDGNDIVGSTSV